MRRFRLSARADLLLMIPQLECYGVQINNMPVTCAPLPPDSGLDGLLGLDFLRAAKATINLHHHILTIPDTSD